MSGLRAFLRQQKGSATVEFALVSVFFFGILMVGLDFGIYAQKTLKLGNAVEQASIVAFDARAAQPAVNTNQISTYITSVVGGSPTVTIRCNGVATCDGTAPATQCIGAPAAAGGWPTFTAATTSNGKPSCADGAAPGNYLVMGATRIYQAVVVPDKYLSGKTMTQQVIVRLS